MGPPISTQSQSYPPSILHTQNQVRGVNVWWWGVSRRESSGGGVHHSRVLSEAKSEAKARAKGNSLSVYPYCICIPSPMKH